MAGVLHNSAGGFHPIANAFRRDAVTYDDLVERAKVQPYVRDELVVALVKSLSPPKRLAASKMPRPRARERRSV